VDRTVTGGSARISADESVRDVKVMAGSLDVYGTVTGDIEVVGGSVHVFPSAHVDGDIVVLGGALTVDEGAEMRGEIGSVAASVSRKDAPPEPPRTGWSAVISDRVSRAGSAISSAALLFLFGAVLAALATKRVDTMRAETAARPMRTLALGVVGSIGAAALLFALCVTIIGIPIALAVALVGVLLTYGGICAVLQTAGEALLRHRTTNPYVHLAAGCALFLIAGSLPWVGGYVTAIVALLGIGAVVATRAGKLEAAPLSADAPVSDGPYRSTF
jgi:hypothetical protein